MRIRPIPRSPPKKKSPGVMNIILVIVGVCLFCVYCRYDTHFHGVRAIPDTLVTCVFAALGGECGIMGWIKTTKDRRRERKWEGRGTGRKQGKRRRSSQRLETICKEVLMALTGKSNEEKIWNYLIARGLSKCGAAGLMGNIYAESALKPTNLQNSFEKKLGYNDESYTAAVDSGSYGNFVKDSAGYGLCQWTFWSRKQNLLEFARAAGKSIGDLEMQLDFLFKELEGYKAVLATLKTATSVRAASDSVLLNFERPADQSEAVQKKRGLGTGRITTTSTQERPASRQEAKA